MDNKILSLEDIGVQYGEEEVLKGLSLDIRDKDFITLLGPSGCGKTTTLRVIGGFLEPNHGKVFFDGKDITGVPPYKRQVNTVFQKYALFPHLNVFENVAFGLRIKKKSEKEIRNEVLAMLEMVGLRGLERRKSHRLSGGQQQRVAMARALVNKPRVLLLDEPLGALDLKLRKELQRELKQIQTAMEITFVYVTHDQEEALTMSDTVVVMNGGKIQQVGTPQDIYNEPINSFVADFIGESNIFDGRMIRDFRVEFAGIPWDCVDKGFGESELVSVVVRPEDIKLLAPQDGMVKGVVTSLVFKGVHWEMEVEQSGNLWLVHSIFAHQIGELVGICLESDAIHIMHRSKEGETYVPQE